MNRQLTRDEVEAELRARASSIEARLDSLEDEAQSVGQSVLRYIYERPFVSIGGALAAGLLLGYLFGGRRGAREVFDIAKANAPLVGRYAETVARDIRYLVEDEGLGVEEATRQVLGENAPLVAFGEEKDKSDSALKALFFTIANTALGIAVRLGTEALLGGLEEDVHAET